MVIIVIVIDKNITGYYVFRYPLLRNALKSPRDFLQFVRSTVFRLIPGVQICCTVVMMTL